MTREKEANSLGKQLTEAETRASTAESKWKLSDVRFRRSSSAMYMYVQISIIVLNNKVLAMVGLISEPVNFVCILGNFGQTFQINPY